MRCSPCLFVSRPHGPAPPATRLPVCRCTVLLRQLPRVQVGSSQPRPPELGATEAGPEGAGLGVRLGGRSSEELWPQPGWALLKGLLWVDPVHPKVSGQRRGAAGRAQKQAGQSHPQLRLWCWSGFLPQGSRSAQGRGGGRSTGGHRGVTMHFTKWADGPDRGTFNREVTQRQHLGDFKWPNVAWGTRRSGSRS